MVALFFIVAAGLLAVMAFGLHVQHALVPFAFTEPGIPRAGNAVRTESGKGVVTSGSLSPLAVRTSA